MTRYEAEFVKTNKNTQAVSAAVNDALRTMNAGYDNKAPRFALTNGLAFKNREIVVKDSLDKTDDEYVADFASIYVMRLSNGAHVAMAWFYSDEENFEVKGSDGVEYIHDGCMRFTPRD